MPTALESIMHSAGPSLPPGATPPSGGAPPPPAGFTLSNDNGPPPPPAGFVVQPTQSMSLGQAAGIGIGKSVRHAMQGAADAIDFAPDIVKAVYNLPGDLAQIITGHWAMGQPVPRNVAGTAATHVADQLGLPKDQTSLDRIGGAIIEGAAASGGVGGFASLTKEAPGVVGAVAHALSANPAANLAAGAGSGAAASTVAEAGGGPIAQTAASLVGGIVGGVAAGGVHPQAARIAETVPREAVINPEGELTDEGIEHAAQNGLHPDELKAAYEAPAQPQGAAAVAAEAPAPVESAPTPEAAPAPVPEAAPEPVAAPAPEAAAAPASDEPLPASAQARQTQAAGEGVDLTKGQATQDFGTQEQEQTLVGQPSAEGNAARQFFQQQQAQIADAVDRFKQGFGDLTATAAERGQQVKDAIGQLRDSGKAGVTALYKQARDLADSMGDSGSNLINLDTAPLLAKLRELFTDEAIPDQVRKALKQQAAKYGLIGDNPQHVEGETSVSLRDSTGQPAGKITFTGQPQRLTIVNAEDLRQKINQLYEADTTKQTQALKPLIDDAVQAAVERAASEGTGNVGKAFQAARAAHVAQQAAFKSKDIVQKLIDWKRGTQTPVVLPENAIRTIFAGGKDAITNLKRIRALLLSSPTEKSKAAWQAIQAHAIGQLFEDAQVLNANHGGGTLGAISGAKLNTAIAKFGVEKLRLLLSPEDFNQLMKLKRIIGDATIPIARTVNHSNTAQKVIQFLAGQGMKLANVARFVPGVGAIAEVATGLYTVGRQASEAKSTLAGIRDFAAGAAAKADEPHHDAAEYAQQFIRVAGSDQILAPLVASAANENRK